MKRDFELIEMLLKEIEKVQKTYRVIDANELKLNCDYDKIIYHLDLMKEMGLIECSSINEKHRCISRITTKGHDYIDS